MSIALLMTWLLRLSRVRVALYGLAKTTMETSNQILLLKVGVIQSFELDPLPTLQYLILTTISINGRQVVGEGLFSSSLCKA